MSALGDPYQMTGPSALAGGWRRFSHLCLLLALTDWRLRFFGSALGYLWSLMRPLMLFGVVYTVFAEVLAVGSDVKYYAVVLLMGIIAYEYFAEATGNAVPSVVDRENFVRKVHFPRLAIPVAITLTSTLNLLLNLVVLVFFFAISGVEPHWGWLQAPFLLALLSPSRPGSRRCCRRCSCRSATSARSGTSSCARCSTRRRCCTRSSCWRATARRSRTSPCATRWRSSSSSSATP